MTQAQRVWFVVVLFAAVMAATVAGAVVVGRAPWSLWAQCWTFVGIVCWELLVSTGAWLIVRRVAAGPGGHRG